VASAGIRVESLGEDLVVVQAPARCRRARHTACVGRALHSDRMLGVRCACSARALNGMGRPKVAALGQLAGPRSSGLLWPWAVVRLGGIVDFFNFLWINSNPIRFELKSSQICSNRALE
jgi:hypothetical protein